MCNQWIFLFEVKIMFVLEISRFSCFSEIHRFQNLWPHHRHCYIMEVTLTLISFESWVLSNWNLVKYWYAVCKTFLTSFWLNAGDWKLVQGPFMILLRWQQGDLVIFDSWHLPFLIVPYSPFQKSETVKSWQLLI